MTGDNKKRYQPSGTTLLEMVVTLGIFLVLMTSMLGVFANTLVVERRALAMQAALDDMRYTREIMSRAIRQANPQQVMSTTTDCATAVNTCFRFTHQSATKGTVVYTYNPTTKTINELSATTGGSAVAITGSKVSIQGLTFLLSGNGPLNDGTPDQQQPRVTISARVSSPLNPAVVANIQTTVSLRVLQE